MKTCTKCKTEQTFDGFSKDSSRRDGLQPHCKKCMAYYRQANAAVLKEKQAICHRANKERNNAISRAYHEANRESLLIKMAEWQKANAEKLRQYRADNSEKRRAAAKAWRDANPERKKETTRIWREQNADRYKAKLREHQKLYYANYYPENKWRYNAHSKARQESMRQATPQWADMAKILAVYEEAARLTRETGIPHHVDHIIPLNGKATRRGPKLVCGFHCHTNLRAISGTENLRRNCYEWPDMPLETVTVAQANCNPIDSDIVQIVGLVWDAQPIAEELA